MRALHKVSFWVRTPSHPACWRSLHGTGGRCIAGSDGQLKRKRSASYDDRVALLKTFGRELKSRNPDDVVPRSGIVSTFTHWHIDGATTRYLDREALEALLDNLHIQGTGLLQKVSIDRASDLLSFRPPVVSAFRE